MAKVYIEVSNELAEALARPDVMRGVRFAFEGRGVQVRLEGTNVTLEGKATWLPQAEKKIRQADELAKRGELKPTDEKRE